MPTATARGVRRRIVVGAVVVLGLVLAVVAFGGYALGWSWTGLSGEVTLWDWLQVLALPAALGVAPLLLRHRRRLTRGHRTAATVVAAAFGVLVLVGYLAPLSWTGFPGNTLWDWLELLLLPAVVATSSLWAGLGAMRPHHLAAGAVAVASFGVLVAAGYLVPLSWTGFSGNTAWDWIKLLLMPLLVPTVLVPLVAEHVGQRLAPESRP
jgi:hypothetical protein